MIYIYVMEQDQKRLADDTVDSKKTTRCSCGVVGVPLTHIKTYFGHDAYYCEQCMTFLPSNVTIINE